MLFLTFTSPLIVLLFLGLLQRYETWMLGDADHPVVLLGGQSSTGDSRHRSPAYDGHGAAAAIRPGGRGGCVGRSAPVIPVLVADLAPQVLSRHLAAATALRSAPGAREPLTVDTTETALDKDQSSLTALNVAGLLQLDSGYTPCGWPPPACHHRPRAAAPASTFGLPLGPGVRVERTRESTFGLLLGRRRSG